MSFPKTDPSAKKFLDSLLPPEPAIERKAMFGNTAAFLNGHMFAGTFGSDIILRLPESAREQLLAEPGCQPFAPPPQGRVMREYVVVPRAWREHPERARPWLVTSLEWITSLPPKERRPRRKPKQSKARPKASR